MNARSRGIRDYQTGKSILSCPYVKGAAILDWQHGFLEAHGSACAGFVEGLATLRPDHISLKDVADILKDAEDLDKRLAAL